MIRGIPFIGISFATLLRFAVLWALHFSCLYAGQFQFQKFSELAKMRYGDDAYHTVTALHQIMLANHQANEEQKLQSINDFFNQQLEFVEDIDLWKQSDYWATPLESIGMQAGDCEDLSIAKYMFLKALRVPNEKLRLTYVRAQMMAGETKSVKAHMVLSYYAHPTADPLILDNLNPSILPASRRPDLVPIFSFNDQALWVAGKPQPKSGAQRHLSKWRDVLLRSHADGIE